MGEVYALSRGNAEADRLNRQHNWLKDFDDGDILHRSIPSHRFKDTKALAVADIATGTGIWLLEFAGQVDNPNTEFVGFDISKTLLSEETQALPDKRIQFVTHDMFKPFPEEYHSRFDIVHVRLVVCAVAKTSIANILRNLRNILKPGGYLAWHEAEYVDFTTQPVHPTALATYKRLEEVVAAYDGSTTLPSDILAEIVEQSRPVESKLSPLLDTSPANHSNDRLPEDQESLFSENDDEHFRLLTFERTTSAVLSKSSRHIGHIICCQVWRNAIKNTIAKKQKEYESQGTIKYRREELQQEMEQDQELIDELDRATTDESFEWHYGLTWIIVQKYPLSK